MKKALFILTATVLLGACASENTSSSDPIENLVSYLDSKGYDQTHKRIRYEGGAVLKTNIEYYGLFTTPEALKSKEYKDLPNEHLQLQQDEAEIQDSCLRAFRWGCTIARQCYHKENHVLDKDTVLYALALDGMDGERIELEGVGSYQDYFVGYKAARAATLRVKGAKDYSEWQMQYITREEKGQEEPFNMRPLTDFIKRMIENVDSVKVYETSYEVTHEDWDGNPSLVGEAAPDEEHTFCGKTTGHLYVIPEASADDVEKGLRICVTNDYLGLNPNQQFFIDMSDHELVVGNNKPMTFSINETVKHQSLYAQKSHDGHFYILVLDETTGAFCIPRCWKHIIQIKDHKECATPVLFTGVVRKAILNTLLSSSFSSRKTRAPLF